MLLHDRRFFVFKVNRCGWLLSSKTRRRLLWQIGSSVSEETLTTQFRTESSTKTIVRIYQTARSHVPQHHKVIYTKSVTVRYWWEIMSCGTNSYHYVFLATDVTFFSGNYMQGCVPERMSYYIPGGHVFVSYGYPRFVVWVTELEQVFR